MNTQQPKQNDTQIAAPKEEGREGEEATHENKTPIQS